jgi:putative hemolysin
LRDRATAAICIGINCQCGPSLREDAGFDTPGGFITFTLGRIPPAGTSFEQGGVKYTVLDAESQRVKRVEVEVAAK